ncbi:MAG: geranylgeranyl reductase family protein [Candidatus Nanopelagicales bacterium]|nr:geranylgeranyl reductase family protein [Candidatus Nanopelagicales bacterium]
MKTDVLVVGAGPAGSAAAAWTARAGLNVTLVDAETFPRDKPCGDGLTPRAIAELDALGASQWITTRARNAGLRAAGFGQTLYLPWPGGSLPNYGSAAPRLQLDDAIRKVALEAGVTAVEGLRATDVDRDERGRVAAVVFTDAEKNTTRIHCNRLIVADGVRSQLGRVLGREWHRSTAYGVAARAYISSGRSDDPWISSHLELRGTQNELLSGYGWIFPLGDGDVNIGVGTLATAKHPADVNLRQLTNHYTDQQREDWELDGELRATWSAMLPMGGAVSGVAGPNWMLVGDAAGCVNPLNGEGIDYGLETGHLAAQLLTDPSMTDFTTLWPTILREKYGLAFSIARRLAGLLTVPGFLTTLGPVGMRSHFLMSVALRVMGNLITEEDKDSIARIWRTAGRASIRFDDRPPFG